MLEYGVLIQNRTQIGHRHPARAAREMATEPVSNRLRGFRGQPGEESSSRPRRTMAELLDTAWENRQLSYAKVRALTRIATTATEADLAEIAGPMTAAQCERFVAAHRKASDTEELASWAERRVSVHVGEDGSMTISAKLPAADGAVVLQALRAAAGDCEHPHRPHGDTAEDTRPAEHSGRGASTCRASLADALVQVAGAYLTAKIAAAGNPDIYQVIVHVGPEALTTGPDGSDPATGQPGVSAETPEPAPATTSAPGHPPAKPAPAPPAFPRRRPQARLRAASPALPAGLPTPRTRDAATSTTARPSAPPLRKPSPATQPCPGCCTTTTATCSTSAGGTAWPPRRCAAPSANATRAAASSPAATPGAPTSTTSLPGPRAARPGCVILILLCEAHHVIVHALGYLITPTQNGFAFTRPDGQPVPSAPALPGSDGDLARCHDADITTDTIVPIGLADKLDLDMAIWACFANARIDAEQASQQQERGLDLAA